MGKLIPKPVRDHILEIIREYGSENVAKLMLKVAKEEQILKECSSDSDSESEDKEVTPPKKVKKISKKPIIVKKAIKTPRPKSAPKPKKPEGKGRGRPPKKKVVIVENEVVSSEPSVSQGEQSEASQTQTESSTATE